MVSPYTDQDVNIIIKLEDKYLSLLYLFGPNGQMYSYFFILLHTIYYFIGNRANVILIYVPSPCIREKLFDIDGILFTDVPLREMV